MPKNHVYATAYNKLPVKTAVTRKAAAAQFSQCERRKNLHCKLGKKKKRKTSKEKLEPGSNVCFLAFHFEFNLTACLAAIFRFSNAKGRGKWTKRGVWTAFYCCCRDVVGVGVASCRCAHWRCHTSEMRNKMKLMWIHAPKNCRQERKYGDRTSIYFL